MSITQVDARFQSIQEAAITKSRNFIRDYWGLNSQDRRRIPYLQFVANLIEYPNEVGYYTIPNFSSKLLEGSNRQDHSVGSSRMVDISRQINNELQLLSFDELSNLNPTPVIVAPYAFNSYDLPSAKPGNMPKENIALITHMAPVLDEEGLSLEYWIEPDKPSQDFETFLITSLMSQVSKVIEQGTVGSDGKIDPEKLKPSYHFFHDEIFHMTLPEIQTTLGLEKGLGETARILLSMCIPIALHSVGISMRGYYTSKLGVRTDYVLSRNE